MMEIWQDKQGSNRADEIRDLRRQRIAEFVAANFQ